MKTPHSDNLGNVSVLRSGLLVVLLCCAGCQQQMAEQPYYRPLDPSEFFDDGRSARHLVSGTVAHDDPRIDRELCTGLEATASAQAGKASSAVALTVARTDLAEKPYVDRLPFAVDYVVLERGQARFQAFCTPCHDAQGTGRGVVVQRGFTEPPSFHTGRLRSAPLGYFYDVISRGYGSMPDYATQIQPRERWEIVAYLRAVQLGQHAVLDDLPAEERQKALAELERHGGK